MEQGTAIRKQNHAEKSDISQNISDTKKKSYQEINRISVNEKMQTTGSIPLFINFLN